MLLTLLYIDPGSGSLFFQALLSAGITILIFFKNIKAYILSFFRKKKDDA